MAFDRDQFAQSLKDRSASRAKEMLPQARYIQAQALVMERLVTGNPQWDRYLSFLQPLTEKARERKAAAQGKLTDPATWNPEDLFRLKSDILRCDAMLEAWDIAMKLPKALIEDSAKAEELIKQFEGTDEPAQQP